MMLVKSYRGRRVQKKVTDSNKTELFVVKDRELLHQLSSPEKISCFVIRKVDGHYNCRDLKTQP